MSIKSRMLDSGDTSAARVMEETRPGKYNPCVSELQLSFARGGITNEYVLTSEHKLRVAIANYRCP